MTLPASHRDGTNQRDRHLPALDPAHAAIDERSTADLLDQVRTLAGQLRFFDVDEAGQLRSDKRWTALLASDDLDTADMVAYLADPTRFEGERARWLGRPHFALLLTFLELLGHARAQLNGFTARHLDHYYRQVLRMVPASAVADRATVLVRLGPRVPDLRLPAGTAMLAGRDSAGVMRVYRTEREHVVNRATVAQLRSVYVERRVTTLTTPRRTPGKPVGTVFAEMLELAVASPPRVLGSREPWVYAKKVLDPLLNDDRERLGLEHHQIRTFVQLVGGIEDDWTKLMKLLPAQLSVWMSRERFDQEFAAFFEIDFDRDRLSQVNTLDDLYEYLDGHADQPAVADLFAPMRAKLGGSTDELAWFKDVRRIKRGIDAASTEVGRLLGLAEPGTTREQLQAYRAEVHELEQDFAMPAEDIVTLIEFFKRLENEPQRDADWHEVDRIFADAHITALRQIPAAERGEQGRPEPVARKVEWRNLHAHADSRAQTPAGDASRWKIFGGPVRGGDAPAPALGCAVRSLLLALDTGKKREIKVAFTLTPESLANSSALTDFRWRTQGALQVEVSTEADWLAPEQQDWWRDGNTLLLLVVVEASEPALVPIADSGDTSPSLRVVLYPRAEGDEWRTTYTPFEPLVLEGVEVEVVVGVEPEVTRERISLRPGAAGIGGHELLHVHPFGSCPVPAAAPSLLPRYDTAGELYIGLDELSPPCHLSLLVQLVEGSADPELEPSRPTWSCLDGDRWRPLEVVLDETRGLLSSGIVELALPRVAPSTLLPVGPYWLRVAISGDPASVCDCVDIHPQAVGVRFDDQGNAADHHAQPLAAGSIKRLRSADARVAALVQPYTSFGGKPAELAETFDTRVSERLRHKQRALCPWDYERLALDFAGIYKAKCLPAGVLGRPGEVEVLVVPDIRGRLPLDVFAPRVCAERLADIEAYLSARAPVNVRVRVRNPVYVPVRVRLSVRFVVGRDAAHASRRLDEDLIRFLSPWAYDEGADITIGGRIYAGSIVDFVDRLDYVDYVANVRLFRPDRNQPDQFILANGDGGLVETMAPDQVLVADRRHVIDLIDDRVSHRGIGYMKIELDFIVAESESAP